RRRIEANAAGALVAGGAGPSLDVATEIAGMLFFHLPRAQEPGFVRGEPVTVRINGVPRLLKFDAVKKTVAYEDDEGPQVRKFIWCSDDGDLVRFSFAGADGSGVVIAPTAPWGITAGD